MPVETITQKLGRDFAAIARRRSLCEYNGIDFGDDGRAEYERALAAVTAHNAGRIGRRRFGPRLILARWARLHGFRVNIIGAVSRLQTDWRSEPAAILVALGANDDGGYFVTFAREPTVGKPRHILGVALATRPEAVRFAGALLAVLS